MGWRTSTRSCEPASSARCRTDPGRRAVQAEVDARSYLGRLLLIDRQSGLTLADDRGTDETGEQRMRLGRPRAELRVCLCGDVVRVGLTRQLDELDQLTI